MGVPGKANFIYEFGPIRLDPIERRLSREGQPITLCAKIFETLCVLVEAHGRLVEKNELINRVWTDAVVEEGNLAFHIDAAVGFLHAPVGVQTPEKTVPRPTGSSRSPGLLACRPRRCAY